MVIRLHNAIEKHSNWVPRGDLTLYDPNYHYPGLDILFVEDMFHLTRKDELFIIDVGWYPDGNVEEGLYRGVVVRNENWSDPIEEFSSRDTLNMQWWVVLMLGKYDG